MPYPEVVNIICPECKVELLIHLRKVTEEQTCPDCGGVFVLKMVPEGIDTPDPRHIC